MIHRVRWFFLVIVCCAPLPAAESWSTGVAKLAITPNEPMWMSGYGGRDHPSEGKLTDLWAKALVIEDAEGQRAVLIALDLVGIDRGLSLAVCEQLRAHYQLERHQIAISTSHTHTGPAVGRNLAPLHYLQVDAQQQQLIDQYATELQQNIVAVVGEAIDRLAPSTLSWGSGTATFAVNRRNNKAAQVPGLRTSSLLSGGTQSPFNGPFDHDVPVLAVRDAAGKLTSVVFGYACHATVLSFYQWSGDYPGFAQIELEKSHPGCVALFFAGCGGDQNPLPRRSVELAKHYGRRLATAVDAALLTAKPTSISGALKATYREIDLPLGALPTRDEIENDASSKNRFVAARAKMLLGQIESGQPLSKTYPYPIGVWQIGPDVQFVFLGGETVVDYAVRLKAELGGRKTWVSGYANDVMAYIPSRRVLREGGYEGASAMVYYGLPTSWAPEVENMIVDEVRRQLGVDH